MFLQAADRRDRLIYVLTQINAARGDDTMHLDEESSDESEEEVCALYSISISILHPSDPTGRRILHPWILGAARSQENLGGILSSQVGFCIPIGEALTGTYCVPIVFLYIYRAQARVAQQRIDSKMPLGRIIDIRKKVFAEVKVQYHFFILSAGACPDESLEIQQSRVTNW